MLVTKANLLIALIVAGFTIAVPGTALFMTYQVMTREIIDTTALAERIEQVATEIEEGRISPTQERFAFAVRAQAVAERARVALSHFQSAGRNFFIAVMAAAAVQFSLVLLVLGRRASASARLH